MAELKLTLAAQEKKIASLSKDCEEKNSIIRGQREDLQQLRNPQGYS